MGGPESRVTRVTRAISALTSQIYRCPGLLHVSPDADNLGAHDLAYWLIFLSLLAAWFLFLFVPQRERLGMLEDRSQVLTAHLKAEKRELARLHRSIKDLQCGDARAWERVARGRLGWVEPGEITDLAKGAPPRPAGSDKDAGRLPTPPAPPPVLPRPAVPPLPVAPVALRPQDLVVTELVGPTRGTPPPAPDPRTPRPAPVQQPAARNIPRDCSLRMARP